MTLAGRARGVYETAAKRFSGQRVVYHHVPRCGGTSINRAFRLRYLLSQVSINATATAETVRQRFPDIPAEEFQIRLRDLRESILIYHLNDYVHWISGHVRFSPAAYSAFSPGYRFMTVLRDPIERYLSDYFCCYKSDRYFRTDLPLEEYLDSFEGRIRTSVYGEYFSGLPADADFTSDEAVTLAIENLAKFDLVGFTDDMQGFVRDASSMLGVRVKVGHENKGRGGSSGRSVAVAPETMGKLQEMCESDMRIYRYAREHLRKDDHQRAS